MLIFQHYFYVYLFCIKDKSPPRTNQLPEKLKYHRIVLGKLNYYWPFNFIFSLDDETLITGPDHLLSLSIYNQNYRKNKKSLFGLQMSMVCTKTINYCLSLFFNLSFIANKWGIKKIYFLQYLPNICLF